MTEKLLLKIHLSKEAEYEDAEELAQDILENSEVDSVELCEMMYGGPVTRKVLRNE